jgi:hypothetical protein
MDSEQEIVMKRIRREQALRWIRLGLTPKACEEYIARGKEPPLDFHDLMRPHTFRGLCERWGIWEYNSGGSGD